LHLEQILNYSDNDVKKTFLISNLRLPSNLQRAMC